MTLKIQKNNKKSLKTIFNIIMARYFVFLILLLMIITFIFAYKIVISPVRASINNEIKKINEDKKNQKEDLSKTLENISNYKKDYENLNPNDKEKINLMIPDADDAEKLFTDIESLILKNGFILNSLGINSIDNISSFKSKKNTKKSASVSVPKDVGIIELNLDISNSSYENFKKLLSVFEDNLRILDVHNIDFSLDGASISFEIRTYYFKKNVDSENE